MKMKVAIKSFADAVLSFLGIVILSPILLIIALLLKLDSPGPVFFSQERLGKHGQIFKIYKFRTMVVNAEAMGDGIKVKSDHDSRITRVGSFLRKTSLDELPQLFNVLKGDMSLVGPRPPVVYHPYDGYDAYPKWAQKRFCMKPGVTGLAQVMVRNAVSWDERIKYDNKYIDNFSLMLDIRLIINTFKKVVAPSSIYLGEK